MSAVKELIEPADFIVKYGFLAVGLFIMMVVTPLIHKLFSLKVISVSVFCSGLAFLAAYGVLDVISKHFPQLIQSRNFIVGTVRNIPDGFQVVMQSDMRNAGQAFIRRVSDQYRKNYNEFNYIILSPQTPTCLTIAISSPVSEDFRVYNVHGIGHADISETIEVILELLIRPESNGSLAVWREDRRSLVGTKEIVTKLDDTEADCASRVESAGSPRRGAGFLSFIATAFAQSAPATVGSRLLSDDVFTRRAARIELSQGREASFPQIGALLDSREYREQLGAASAIAVMPDDVRQQLPPGIQDQLRALTQHPDNTMRFTAGKALGLDPVVEPDRRQLCTGEC